MESKNPLNQKSTNRVRHLFDPGEFDRVLMQYGGVFKNAVKEYAEKYLKGKAKPQKNLSR